MSMLVWSIQHSNTQSEILLCVSCKTSACMQGMSIYSRNTADTAWNTDRSITSMQKMLFFAICKITGAFNIAAICVCSPIESSLSRCGHLRAVVLLKAPNPLFLNCNDLYYILNYNIVKVYIFLLTLENIIFLYFGIVWWWKAAWRLFSYNRGNQKWRVIVICFCISSDS